MIKVVADLVPNQMWLASQDHPQWVSHQRALVERALGVLDHQVDLDEYWSSESVIEIDTDALHPWVWDAANGLWDSEHWGEAVEAAVKVLNAQLQMKTGRNDISGTALVGESFSLDPPKGGRVRLRVIEDDGSETYRSMQQGAMYLGMAVFMLWRNPLSHVPGGSPMQQALEGLAAASAFAQLIEASSVITDVAFGGDE